METRYWIVKTEKSTYIICYNGKQLYVNNRYIEIPCQRRPKTGASPIDFRLPIDEIECWFRFPGITFKYAEVYVNGEILPDTNNAIYLAKAEMERKAIFAIGFCLVVLSILTLILL